ncbi:MAG: DUF4957 domain-containing protein [Prevotella sp.]|nr:DUF4957 domain-containing protein [Prevotella sp.]
MKSKLTLLMVALLSVCAFAATTWKATEETPVAAGSTLIDDELVTAKTVYETTLKTAVKEIAGEEFTHYIQVRVDAAPTADEPNGTNKEGSTPIILTAKKDLTLKIYYRRQSTSQNEDSGVYASNDGKDLKIVNQADLSQLDGTLTIVEETEDFKYAWVTKEYELAEGNTYTIFGRGTTINYYGMTYEGKEPPAPVVGDAIELNLASGDISAELAAAMENNPYPASITINLAANGAYTVSQAIETVGNLTIQGDAAAPATIDASGLTAPMIQVKSDLAAFQPNETTGFYELGDISISNVKVTGLAQQLIYGNKVKALYGKVAIENSIVEVAGGSKTMIDFNGGGVAEVVSINNSTIYANPQHSGTFYSSQSGQKATEAGLETQTISITNSTLYNIAYAKNVNTHRQANQTFLAYELKNSVILDCGKEGQFVKGLNQGQSGKNPTWMIDGNSFLRTVEGAITDMSASEETGDEEEPVTNNVEGVAVFANDINTGDFTFDQCPQNEARIGDPRWLVDVVVPMGEPIESYVDEGEDIGAKLIAAMETNKYPSKITINLLGGKNYQVVTPIQVNCPLEFSVWIEEILDPTHANEYANIDASALTGPMIQISDDIHPSLLKDNGFYDLGDIIIGNLKIKGLSQQLVYGNKVKALYGNVLLYHSIVEVAGGSKTVIDFNGGGVAKTVSIKESTIYANPQHTGTFYSSQSGQKATEAGLEKQTISITNSTLYNIAYAKNVNTHRQANQTFFAYELKNSVILDCGKEGQFVKGLNQGQAGKNPTWMIDGNSFLRTVEGVITDMSASEETGDEEEPVTNNVEGVAVFANDINTGDFTFDQCPQNEARIGDPRWLVEVKEASFEGKYYLYNVGSQRYWGAANDWGTQASLIEHPDYVTLAQTPDGAYTMETQVSNGGTSYYFGGDYMDGQPVNLTITKAGDGLYTIANADGQLYGYDGNSYILGKNVPEGNNALWKIISEADMLASLNAATVNAPVDATFLIIDHTFGRNNRNVGVWKVSEDCTNYNLTGGNSDKHSAESYHSTFTVSQVLSNVPNGIYSFQAQGFYRQDGSDNENLAQFFINDETVLAPLKTGSENSMADACASFEKGLYKISPLYVEVKDGQITVGIKNENNPTLWVIWDNFELCYYGADATLDEVKNAAIISQLAELREKATKLQGQPKVEVVNTALANALAETADVTASSSVDDINAAIEKLTAVIDNAEASIIAANVLPAMKELIDATNVYTQAAYEEYYGQWLAKYEAGTLTKAEASALQDPSLTTGWHAPITVDNFLLSAWDTNVDFVDAPYYINTWSTEGENDGSGFRVPFFEYWTGDDQSLGERTLTATMTDLEPGKYNVSALVRVRVKNGVKDAPTGITLQANDGEAVPVTTGAQIGESQFYLDTFTAQGVVGEDGILKIQFNIAAENNISWLSFKNVNYAIEGIGEPLYVFVNYGDIAAEVAAAMETNPYPSKIKIGLVGGSDYQWNSPIQLNCPLEFMLAIPTGGNEVGYANIDASALTGPMIQISDNIHSDLLADNGFYQLGDIKIEGVRVKGLTQQLIYGNKAKAQYGTLALENSIIEMAGGNKTVFDFNGGGVVEKLSIHYSTIYGNPQHTGQLYSSQSGQKATEAGLEKQTISITNSTLYNIAYSKNVNTHRQANQTWLAYELKNSIIIDCGKQGQFVKGLNGGQQGANPTWMIDGNSFQWTVDGVLTDISASEETADDAEPVANNVEGVVVFANDITTGDFTLGECPQKTAKIGDPRWLYGPTVGIDNVNVNTENDVWFNLQGVRVTTPTKGLFIKNGKKVVVK